MEIEFHNREKEIERRNKNTKLQSRLDLLRLRPHKSCLMLEVAKRLPKDYVVFYVDLRKRFIRSYEDFIKVLFKVHRTKVKDYRTRQSLGGI